MRTTSHKRGLSRIAGALLAALSLLLIAVSPAQASSQYYFNASKTSPTTHCYTGYGPSSYTDLLDVAPTGVTSTTFSGSALFGCTNAFPAGATLTHGSGSLDVWLTNTTKAAKNAKPCVTPWFLQHNATPSNAGTNITGAGVNGNPYITVPAGTTTPTKFTVNFHVPDASLPPFDQLMLMIDVRTQSGPCSQMTMYYGSAGTLSDLSLPTLAAAP